MEQKKESSEEDMESISMKESKEIKRTKIGNKEYDEDTMNRITIVRLTQVGMKPEEIKKILNVSRSLLWKWVHYDQRVPKKMGRPKKFNEEQLDFIYKNAEGKLTISNRASSRNIATKFFEEYHEQISNSYICKILLKKFGRPYRGINSVLLTEDHKAQRIAFAEDIISQGIKSSEIMFTDECRIILYPKINPKINVIRLSDSDKANIHSFDVNKKRTFLRPKFEVSIMVAGGICKAGLSNLVFCSGTMNNFSYKQFLIFLKQDMEQLKLKNNLPKDLLFQKDNASCHKSQESLEAIKVLFGDNTIWWPANSPDLSPIETVWAIVKQELTKRKNTTLDELRNNVLDIWAKFPDELCSKIVSEFEEKIIICQKENGNIINKKMLKKYRDNVNSENNENIKINIEYDWKTLRREKIFRIVYNDKIIGEIKKKTIKRIKSKLREKIVEYKKNNPKATKSTKLVGGVNKETYNNRIKNELEEINKQYESVIKYITKLSNINFIEQFLNKGFVNNKKYLINSNLSKKIELDERFIYELIKNLSLKKLTKDISIDEEIDIRLDNAEKRGKINSIRKYLPNEIKIEPFPNEQKKFKESDEEIDSETTELTIKDCCSQLKDLDENIKKFRRKNKDIREKEKKIRIPKLNQEQQKNDVPDDEENYADDESSYNSNEEGEDGAVEENEELE